RTVPRRHRPSLFPWNKLTSMADFPTAFYVSRRSVTSDFRSKHLTSDNISSRFVQFLDFSLFSAQSPKYQRTLPAKDD
ncbi:MAG: hypothetical protein O7A08_10780, partial [SAR324 cluster bacterium]|nr:hypothetical protein [SAR324 cluster bacterium]